MERAWVDFLRVPEHGHAVQVYAEPAELAVSVARFVASGVAAGEPAMIVARPESMELFAERLAAAEWDARVLEEVGLLTVRDAEELLERVRATSLEAAVGPVLDALTARFPERTVRVFGEMVDILVRRGEHAAAAALEDEWNELAKARDFTLLCGYELDVFDRATQAGALQAVCQAHTHVKPAGDTARFARAVECALVDVLGPTQANMVYRMVADDAKDARTPVTQHVLMWVSAHMPSLSERVLANARGQYASAEVRS